MFIGLCLDSLALRTTYPHTFLFNTSAKFDNLYVKLNVRPQTLGCGLGWLETLLMILLRSNSRFIDILLLHTYPFDSPPPLPVPRAPNKMACK